MKNKLYLIGIIAFVAVIGFSFAACDDGSNPAGGGNAPLTLDGNWQDDSGMRISISGSSGVITSFGRQGPLWQDAINKGFVKIGDRRLQNISSIGNLIWSAQISTATYNSSNPTVALGTGWVSCTITMTSNGKTFHVAGTDSTGTSALTYTRR